MAVSAKTLVDITPLSQNTWLYDTSKPKESFTMTLEPSADPNVKTFTYRPSDTSDELTIGRRGLDALRHLHSLLPSHTLSVSEWGDYPTVIPAEKIASLWNAADHMPVSRREIFILAGIPFFRRYDNDWNPTLMAALNGFSWAYPVGASQIIQLDQLVSSKGYAEVTHDEVRQIVYCYGTK